MCSSWRIVNIGLHMTWWFAASNPPSSTLGISTNVTFPNPPTLCHPFPSPPAPQQAPACDVPFPESICSHCSIPTYEWEQAMFGFLFLCQFASSDGFQLHSCPWKGHDLTLPYGYIVFYSLYVPRFLYPGYHWWAFGLVPSLCYREQCSNKHTCAGVLIVERFIILWVYTQ